MTSSLNENGGMVTIGDFNNSDSFFRGYISEVKCWNVVKTLYRNHNEIVLQYAKDRPVFDFNSNEGEYIIEYGESMLKWSKNVSYVFDEEK